MELLITLIIACLLWAGYERWQKMRRDPWDVSEPRRWEGWRR